MLCLRGPGLEERMTHTVTSPNFMCVRFLIAKHIFITVLNCTPAYDKGRMENGENNGVNQQANMIVPIISRLAVSPAVFIMQPLIKQCN